MNVWCNSSFELHLLRKLGPQWTELLASSSYRIHAACWRTARSPKACSLGACGQVCCRRCLRAQASSLQTDSLMFANAAVRQQWCGRGIMRHLKIASSKCIAVHCFGIDAFDTRHRTYATHMYSVRKPTTKSSGSLEEISDVPKNGTILKNQDKSGENPDEWQS